MPNPSEYVFPEENKDIFVRARVKSHTHRQCARFRQIWPDLLQRHTQSRLHLIINNIQRIHHRNFIITNGVQGYQSHIQHLSLLLHHYHLQELQYQLLLKKQQLQRKLQLIECLLVLQHFLLLHLHLYQHMHIECHHLMIS